ncbi:MAG TPA: hypothetical protein VGN16_04975 [Acidobacteriaceae bacterium]|jgi:hypothetical protein
MAEEIEFSQGKSLADLGRDAFWFLVHTVIALVVLLLLCLVISVFHPDPDASGPKIIASFLSFLVPLFVGLAVVKARPSEPAAYVWLAGVLIFAIACVWVLDLPTGPGLCEHCGAFDKLWRTLTPLSIGNGSGLIGGQGLAIGTWIPLSLIGYSAGARFALNS